MERSIRDQLHLLGLIAPDDPDFPKPSSPKLGEPVIDEFDSVDIEDFHTLFKLIEQRPSVFLFVNNVDWGDDANE